MSAPDEANKAKPKNDDQKPPKDSKTPTITPSPTQPNRNFPTTRPTYPPQVQRAPPNSRPILRNITSSTTGRPTGYANQTVVPGIAYMALLVSPYKAPNSTEGSSLVITIPPMANFAIRGLFYHPSFGSVTAAITPQPGAKQVLRRFLIGPQLVRTVIAKNTQALKSLSQNTAGYLAAGLVCGIPLYIVFTGSTVPISNTNAASSGGKPGATATQQPITFTGTPPSGINLRASDGSFVNSPMHSTFQRVASSQDPKSPVIPSSTPRSVLSTASNTTGSNKLPQRQIQQAGGINPNMLSSSTPSFPNSNPSNLSPDQSTLALIEELIKVPESSSEKTNQQQQQQSQTTNDSTTNNDNNVDDDLFSMSPDSLSMLEGFDFWNNFQNDDSDTIPNNSNSQTTNSAQIRNKINPSPLSSDFTSQQQIKSQNIPSSSQIHSVATGSLQYSPLKKIDLSGTVNAITKKKQPLLSPNHLRTALNSSSPAAYIPPPVEPKLSSSKLSNDISSPPNNNNNAKASPKKPPRTKKKNTTPEWSVIDKALFQKALVRFGTAFGPIAACIGTKSSTHVKRYYHEHGGAKGYFKTLLNEHHHLKRQNSLETFDTSLTIDEKKHALNNDGLLSLSLSYMNDSKKRKRPNSGSNENSSGARSGKKAKLNDSVSIPTVDYFDPTSNMSHSQRQEYIYLKVETILNSNEKKDFLTPKAFEDHLFPCRSSNGPIKQDIDTLVFTDSSLQIPTAQSEINYSKAFLGEDDDIDISFTNDFAFKPLQQQQQSQSSSENQKETTGKKPSSTTTPTNDCQPFYTIVFDNIPPAKGDPNQNGLSSSTSSLHSRDNNNKCKKDPNDHTDSIPPLYLDVALSSHPDLADLTSWSSLSPDSSNVPPSLHTSTPNLTSFHSRSTTTSTPFRNLPTEPQTTPIFGKQSLFNFSHCASLFQQKNNNENENNNQPTTQNEKKSATQNNNYCQNISPIFVTIPRNFLRTKNSAMDIDTTTTNSNILNSPHKPTKLNNNNNTITSKISTNQQNKKLSSFSTTITPNKFLQSNFYPIWNCNQNQKMKNEKFLYDHFCSFTQSLPLFILPIAKQIKIHMDSKNLLTQVHFQNSRNENADASQFLNSNSNSNISCNSFSFNGKNLQLLSSLTLNGIESPTLQRYLLSNDHSPMLFELCYGGQILAISVQNKIVLYDLNISNENNNNEPLFFKELQEHSSDIIHLSSSSCFPYLFASFDKRGCIRIWNMDHHRIHNNNHCNNINNPLNHNLYASNSNSLSTTTTGNQPLDHFIEFKEIQRNIQLDEVNLLWCDSGIWLALYDKHTVNLYYCKQLQRSKTPSRFSFRCPKDEIITTICFSPSSMEISDQKLQSSPTCSWLFIATENSNIYVYNLQEERNTPVYSSSINTVCFHFLFIFCNDLLIFFFLDNFFYDYDCCI